MCLYGRSVDIMHLKYMPETLQGEIKVTEALVNQASGTSQGHEVKLLDGLVLPTGAPKVI